MAYTFRLPDLGEGIHEAEIVAIPVKVGDKVREGEIILEVETDKAVVEIPSPFTGVISTIHVQPGYRVVVGDELIGFDEDDNKATGVYQSAAPAGTQSSVQGYSSAEKKETPERKQVVPASPATRRLAMELKVPLELVTPSGPEGLVTSQDVKNFAAAASSSPDRSVAAEKQKDIPAADRAVPTDSSPDVAAAIDFSRWGSIRREKMHAIRRATARRMALAWSQIPHVNSQDSADITQIEAIRRDYKPKMEQRGVKLTLMAFTLKAVTAALKTFPRFNASLDPGGEEIILKEYYHIGVAVNTSDGLIVPVIRDVDRKSIIEIALELTDLVARTRSRKVKLEELQGGTFTITNAGSMGGGYFAPIINFPETAILGLGQARWQPVVDQADGGNHHIITRLMLPLILSIDHRVLDGADAIAFLLQVRNALEDPRELLMTMT